MRKRYMRKSTKTRNTVRKYVINTASLLSLFLLGFCQTAGNFCDVYVTVPTLDGGRKAQRDAIDKNNAYHDAHCSSWTQV